MAEKYDPLPDLAALVVAALGYSTVDPAHYAGRITMRLRIVEDESPETVAEVLREALGLDAASVPGPPVMRGNHGPGCGCTPCKAAYGTEAHGAVAVEFGKPPPGCDAEQWGDCPSVLDGQCRCMTCARCGHHSASTHQGHYWSFCSVTGTMREAHFCCKDPAFGCELEQPAAEAHQAVSG